MSADTADIKPVKLGVVGLKVQYDLKLERLGTFVAILLCKGVVVGLLGVRVG